MIAAEIASGEIWTPWKSSYVFFNHSMINLVDSLSGSFTTTSWNLLFKAASFSITFWYSSKVVAPISFNFPLDSIGLSIWAASLWSCPPAQIIVWTSSIKRMMLFEGSTASSRIDFILASNSPRYLVPATKVPISKRKRRFPLSLSGTFHSLILWANPSTIAVLPTHGSQMSRGLFFVLRRSVYITWSISFSRQIIGSIKPFLHSLVKSVPKYSIFSFFSSFFLVAVQFASIFSS